MWRSGWWIENGEHQIYDAINYLTNSNSWAFFESFEMYDDGKQHFCFIFYSRKFPSNSPKNQS